MWPSRWFGSGKIRCRDFSIFHFPLLFLDKSFPSQGWGNQKGQLWLQLVREGQVCENFFALKAGHWLVQRNITNCAGARGQSGGLLRPRPPDQAVHHVHLTITISPSPSYYHHLIITISPPSSHHYYPPKPGSARGERCLSSSTEWSQRQERETL